MSDNPTRCDQASDETLREMRRAADAALNNAPWTYAAEEDHVFASQPKYILAILNRLDAAEAEHRIAMDLLKQNTPLLAETADKLRAAEKERDRLARDRVALQTQIGEQAAEVERAATWGGKLQAEVKRLQRAIDAVNGWRENDWPEGFCRRTAEMIAERMRRELP